MTKIIKMKPKDQIKTGFALSFGDDNTTYLINKPKPPKKPKP